MYVLVDIFNRLHYCKTAPTARGILDARTHALSHGHIAHPQWARIYWVDDRGFCTNVPVSEIRRIVRKEEMLSHPDDIEVERAEARMSAAGLGL